ncbi:hypothetical protein L218DRAFT_949887 [Marasmius fiardii PR-910]|nr:hypothetical protein L218DRAFT_949887 [Marasmius fiardii PR-910]
MEVLQTTRSRIVIANQSSTTIPSISKVEETATLRESMAQDYAPRIGTGVNLFVLFGLSSAADKICGAFVVLVIFAYFSIRSRYPCRSAASLARVIDRASTVFDECLATRSFLVGEYDKFDTSLRQIACRASEIAARTQHGDMSRRRLSLRDDYCEWISFLWTRFRDIVQCYSEAQRLIHDLEVNDEPLIPVLCSSSDREVNYRCAWLKPLIHVQNMSDRGVDFFYPLTRRLYALVTWYNPVVLISLLHSPDCCKSVFCEGSRQHVQVPGVYFLHSLSWYSPD